MVDDAALVGFVVARLDGYRAILNGRLFGEIHRFSILDSRYLLLDAQTDLAHKAFNNEKDNKIGGVVKE